MCETLPIVGWWPGVLAEAHWRYLVRTGVIKPLMARSRGGCRLIVFTNPDKRGMPGPVPTRTIRAVLKATRIKSGKGNKPNLQLLYDLALWLIEQWRDGKATPKRALREYQDATLWRVLQRHKQIHSYPTYWDSLPAEDLGKLELRLYRHWPIVERVAKALEQPHKRMTNKRRKPANSMQHMVSALTHNAKP